jgi:hypothetical protein
VYCSVDALHLTSLTLSVERNIVNIPMVCAARQIVDHIDAFNGLASQWPEMSRYLIIELEVFVLIRGMQTMAVLIHHT